MDGSPSVLGKIKAYYVEIICATFFAAAVGYFAYSMHGNRQSVEFLSQAKSKLLLMEAREKRAIESKLNEEEDKSCRECFEAALADAGFKIIKIEHKLNHISAVVVNNAGARARLLDILEGVQYIESRDTLEVRWFFNKKAVEASSENEKHAQALQSNRLSAICYFGDNSWQVWINGKMYDAQNRELENGGIIQKVTAESVVVKNGKQSTTLVLD